MVGPPDAWGKRGRRASGGTLGRSGGDAHVAQSVERILGKDEVTGSIPVVGSAVPALEESSDTLWRR